MFLSLSLLGLAAQIPFQTHWQDLSSGRATQMKQEFSFKEGPDVFTPKDLVELARPGEGVANDAGDLVLVPVSKYSFENKKNHKSVYIASLQPNADPIQIPLPNGGSAFWLDSGTIAHVSEVGEEGNKKLEIYASSIQVNSNGVPEAADSPELVGTLPTLSATNFRYSLASGILVFSDYVYADGNLNTVKEQDEAWENRGTTALVYDSAYERHWDHWIGPKKSSLFSVELRKHENGKWQLGSEFMHPLAGTNHSTPVEPFGGTDDFDISDTQIVYTTKDPILPEAWHTKQNVYIVDIRGGGPPRELTSGEQGATHSPIFNFQGDKVAWLELAKDGYESDRAKVIIYDLKQNVRYTLTQNWDRSPDGMTFSQDGDFIYFTAGDEAVVKVFVIEVPPTPDESTNDPELGARYQPVELTHTGAASGIQALPNSRALFSRSSLTSPNDVFLIKNLDHLANEGILSEEWHRRYSVEQITTFTRDALRGKDLDEGVSFWFKGADDRDVQGWAMRPKGFKKGERRKWPAVLLIHGGPQGAWEDQWSTRWNPNVFAQQGYFTIAINPTGSTTFGQSFVDAITEDWGGKPFIDLQKGWKHALHAWPEIDPHRAVAAGASWGGYAINWIQGHPEYEFGFKALVCHDGVFDSNYNGYSTDELFFFNHDWGGRPWENHSKALSELYSPVNYVDRWSTPQLLIHGSKDYRLPETESIGAFHALQQRGIPSRLVIFPDENHWVLNHGNSLKWHYEVFRWFDLFVGVVDGRDRDVRLNPL